MSGIEKLVRLHIKALTSYSSARDEYTGVHGVFLDANENPFGDFNRYPDPHHIELKEAIGRLKNVDIENIFLGNGSDEIIDLLLRVFCNPGSDKVITFEPTFGMYEKSAEINDVEVLKFNLDKNFQINPDRIDSALNDSNLKVIFICSPNNPTGNVINPDAIEFILHNFEGAVVIDEAYIDFSSSSRSWVSKLKEYSNLIVLQTLSKAWGLAGLRIGIALSNSEVIRYLNKVKPPYNISSPNQQIALERLSDKQLYQKQINSILAERERVVKALANCAPVNKVYPSDANFILVEVDNADKRYKHLVRKGIIVRNRDKKIKNCLRITIGSSEENNQLISAFNQETSVA